MTLPENTASATIAVDVDTGSFSGTLQFEGSVDGSTWISMKPTANSSNTNSSTTATGSWQFNPSSYIKIRVRASARVSGTAAITINWSQAVASDGGSFSPASPGPIGGTTPAAITGTSIYANTVLETNAEYDNGTCTTSKTIAAANGTRQKVLLTDTDTCALTFTQPASGTASITLKITQSSAGAFSGAISGGKWPGAVVPTITKTTGAVDFISCYLDGTNAYCVATQDFR